MYVQNVHVYIYIWKDGDLRYLLRLPSLNRSRSTGRNRYRSPRSGVSRHTLLSLRYTSTVLQHARVFPVDLPRNPLDLRPGNLGARALK